MESNGLMKGFYHISEWSMKLAYLNLLWIVFCFLGGILFGIGPSTVAMFAVTRKWVMDDEDTPIFKTFWTSYRKEFINANFLVFILLLIGSVLYININILEDLGGIVYIVHQSLTFGFILLFIILMLYIFPVFVHYKFNFFNYIKNSLLIGITRPILTILMLLSIATLYIIFKFIPGLLPFFSCSILSMMLMSMSHRAFKKQSKLNN